MARFLVTRAPGPAWDHANASREQAGWDPHAEFMDAPVDWRLWLRRDRDMIEEVAR